MTTQELWVMLFRELFTGATYTPNPIEELTNKATAYTQSFQGVLPPVDQELESVIDRLVEEQYSPKPTAVLTRYMGPC